MPSAAETQSAKVLWSETIGQIESGDGSAVISALAIADPQHAGKQIRGVRIALTLHGTQSSVYIDAREFAVLTSHINLWGTGWARMAAWYHGIYSTNCPDEESQRLPLFLDYRGMDGVTMLFIRGHESLSFTDLTPPVVAAIFTRASLRLKTQ